MTITKEGALASFYTVNKAPIKHLRVYFSPKQSGSGDPSPENIRPIEGWNNIQFAHSGKSLFPFKLQSYGPIGQWVNGTSMWWAKQEIVDSLLKNRTITFSANFDMTNVNNDNTYKCAVKLWSKNQDGTWGILGREGNYIANGTKGRSKVTYTYTNYKENEFGVTLPAGAIASNPMVELGNQITEYESYKGTIQTIDWTNTIGTVYGGYVDLITGELVQEWDSISYIWSDGTDQTIDDETKLKKKFQLNYIPISGNSNNISNILLYGYGNNVYIYNVSTNGAGKWAYVTVPSTIISDTEIQFVYKLYTPITYQLTPQQLSTFIGQNNIWSNADRVEVEYDLAESSDELYKRRNIILQGAPHITTPEPATLQHFNTDITAPLKECKIYFNPIQEGSGDPSPENIREISGWNNLMLHQYGNNLIDLLTTPCTAQSIISYNISNNTLTLTANSNGGYFGQYTALFNIDEALRGKEVYFGVTSVTLNTNNENHKATVICEYRDKDNKRIADPTIISWTNGGSSNFISRKYTIPEDAVQATLLFRIAQNGSTYSLTVGDTVTYHNFYIRYPTEPSGDYEVYNGQTISLNMPLIENLLDKTTITTGKTLNSTDGSVFNETGMAVTDYIPVKEGEIYKLSFTSTEGARTRRIFGYDANKDPVSSLGSASWVTIGTNYTLTATIPSGVKFIRACYLAADTNKILEGPDSYTLYGGYVDLIKGELIQTHFLFSRAIADMNNNENYPGWKICYDFANISNYVLDTTSGYKNNLIGNIGTVLRYNSKGGNYNQPTVWLGRPDYGEEMTMTKWKTDYPNLVVQFILPLATPIHHQLTPQQLKTLQGTNNIWSNANGPIEIQYWTH